MAARRWDGTEWVEFTRRRRRVSNGWVSMNGFRWDGTNWVRLWTSIQDGGVTPTVLFLNLDEPTPFFITAYDLAQEPQYQ